MNASAIRHGARRARRFLDQSLILACLLFGASLLAGFLATAATPATSQPAAAPAATHPPDPALGRLQAHVRMLTASEAEGRGPGSKALDRLAVTIADEFRLDGLTPGGDNGSYLQSFTPPAAAYPIPPAQGTKWGELALKNVVAILPGQAGPDAKIIVFGAHYDHLGINPEGQRCPGADDNASGVAELCELARRLPGEGPFRNTLVFAAFSGEEEGVLGSRYYVEHPALPLAQTMAMLCLDTVGRMEGKKLYVFGSASADEFAEMLKGINLGAGLELVTPGGAMFASDQIPFFEKSIPVLHFFTGPNADYHKPSDTEDKMNYQGMLDLLGFLDETAVFLANREGALHFKAPVAAPAPGSAAAAGGPRRVSLGTIPDFSRESGGVLISGTMPGSPAEKAGLEKGDLLVRLGSMSIDNLADLSAALKGHQPGDTVEVEVLRGGQKLLHRVQLAEKK